MSKADTGRASHPDSTTITVDNVSHWNVGDRAVFSRPRSWPWRFLARAVGVLSEGTAARLRRRYLGEAVVAAVNRPARTLSIAWVAEQTGAARAAAVEEKP